MAEADLARVIQRALASEQRAREAEERARVAEERAQVAEARAREAEDWSLYWIRSSNRIVGLATDALAYVAEIQRAGSHMRELGVLNAAGQPARQDLATSVRHALHYIERIAENGYETSISETSESEMED